MKYAIIPLAAIVLLNLHYKVINQLSKGTDETFTKIPFFLLEDDFTESQITEITSLDGIVFESKEDYFTWLETQMT